ncbi:related to epoxide hydrolase [Armillaria ostoyae]|uniref:Related to epoxide hydrolase n=1 Tax=Armillaria ostoyae TaxID=47428 RepID=A0A284REU1_ARMOS|nr:related to epoxide hydrolase [Armillaria ostoyae]
MTETPFSISIPDEKLELLRKKLELTTLPDELEDSGWKYGVPLGDIKRLVARWKDGFDWRAQEAILNEELPQFTRDIQVQGHGTLNIHYVHQKSPVVDAIPLLFIHGWPGSFIEVRKILPLLTASSPDYPSFHVVALSLPGYGFSQATKKQGFKTGQHAEVGNKLMVSLGYDKYVTQGGDWGAIITRKLSSVYGGAHSQAWHSKAPDYLPTSFISPTHAYALYGNRKVRITTNQMTIGYSLADSPVGLLSWIYEKLVNWSDSYPWDDDEGDVDLGIHLLSEDRVLTKEPTIPLGLSYFPKEVRCYPRLWSLTEGNLVFESEHTSGGHFAAHEKPHELVDDLRKMFGKDGPAFGVVPGRTVLVTHVGPPEDPVSHKNP